MASTNRLRKEDGSNRREEKPFGDIDENWLHDWLFDDHDEHRTEVDAIVDSGATIMGRNMSGSATCPAP